MGSGYFWINYGFKQKQLTFGDGMPEPVQMSLCHITLQVFLSWTLSFQLSSWWWDRDLGRVGGLCGNMCFLWLANVYILKQTDVPNELLHSLCKNRFVCVPSWSPHPTPPLLLKNVKTALQATLVSVKIPVTIWKENRAKTSGLKYIGIAFLQSSGLLCENKQGSNLLEDRGFYP